MERKIKTLFIMSLLFVTFCANAQIKVHSDNHISIGSLSKAYGVQVAPSGYTYFGKSTNSDWDWINISHGSDITLRATDFIVIDKNFEIQSGAKMTLMVHECPSY